MVKPDAKGRITLGHLADGVSRFAIIQDKNNRLILEPYSDVPSREVWLFRNEQALNKVKQGLNDASTGKLIKRGSFKKHLDEDIE